MSHVVGLRSPYALVDRLVYVGRMFDKIRLKLNGQLPEAYAANFGETNPYVFDGRCCRFLGIAHADLIPLVATRAADEECLAEIERRVGRKSDEECLIWNRFMTKIGWRDERAAVLRERIEQAGLAPGAADTSFDLLDIDEGRDPVGSLAWQLKRFDTLIVMGVAGSGKTTVGRALAAKLGWEYIEGDAFHPAENVAKMAAGQPLTDADRRPWLLALRAKLEAQRAAGRHSILGCSALRQAYRDLLAPDLGFVRFVHLTADPSLLAQRLETRIGHFAGPALLPTQLSTLEPPLSALTLDSSLPLDEICARIQTRLAISS